MTQLLCRNCNAKLTDKQIQEFGQFCDSLCRHGYQTIAWHCKNEKDSLEKLWSEYESD